MEALLLKLSGLPAWKIGLTAFVMLQGWLYVVSIPEEVIVTTLGLLWGQGKIPFWEAMACIQLGLWPANLVWVFAGEKLGPRVLRMRPFCWLVSPEAVAAATERFRRRGKWVVFVTRFTPVIRGPVYLSAGLAKIGLFNFWKIDALASCIEVPILLWVGRKIGTGAGSLMQAYGRIGLLMGALLLGSILFSLKRDPSSKAPKL